MGNYSIYLAGLAFLLGCSQPNQYQEPPPPPVTVAQPVIRTVTNFLDETGTTEAVDRVEIRARVRGFLDEVLFTDGQTVEAGQTLYSIQPQEYISLAAAAKARLESTKVALVLAEAEFNRYEDLLASKAVSQSEYDEVKAQRDAAIAARDAAAASLDQAELDRTYCDVKAPIAGRVERTLVKRGNLVGEQEATLLTTVVAYDPINVYFNISEREFLEATGRDNPNEDSREERDITTVKAYAQRATDRDFPFEGHLDYVDLGIDETTGTFKIRAVFPNPDKDLIPGLFVRVRIPLGTIKDAVLVPERCFGFDQAGRYVLVLGDDGVVERRLVEAGGKYGDLVVVTEGLTGNEAVIIDGIQAQDLEGKYRPRRFRST